MEQVLEKKIVRPTEEAYEELQKAFDFFNDEFFEGMLPACMLTFQREKHTMGYFSPERFVRRDNGLRTDEISLNPAMFAGFPMVEILQTVVHEQCHAWQHHFGTPSRQCYHNREWADKMESIGLIPSSTGRPGGNRTGQKMADYIQPGGRMEIAVKKLLATGFAISWLDRFPAMLPALSDALLAVTPFVTSGSTEINDVVNEPEFDALYAAAFIVPAPEQQQAMGLEIRKPQNRSNRSKYGCPKCALRVWAKPLAKIKCGKCDLLLDELTASGAEDIDDE